jgi:hypothetical protein
MILYPREPGGYVAYDPLEAMRRNQDELTHWSVWQAWFSRLGFGVVSFAAGWMVMALADQSRQLREAQARIEKLEGELIERKKNQERGDRN